jgi:hypothetical protein
MYFKVLVCCLPCTNVLYMRDRMCDQREGEKERCGWLLWPSPVKHAHLLSQKVSNTSSNSRWSWPPCSRSRDSKFIPSHINIYIYHKYMHRYDPSIKLTSLNHLSGSLPAKLWVVLYSDSYMNSSHVWKNRKMLSISYVNKSNLFNVATLIMCHRLCR